MDFITSTERTKNQTSEIQATRNTLRPHPKEQSGRTLAGPSAVPGPRFSHPWLWIISQFPPLVCHILSWGHWNGWVWTGTNPHSASRISGIKIHTTQDALPFPPKSTPSASCWGRLEQIHNVPEIHNRDPEDQQAWNKNSCRGTQYRGELTCLFE